MIVNREQLIKRLAEKSGFYQKHIKSVLQALDEVVLECFAEVADDEDVSIQLIQGCKINARVMPKRERVDPRTLESIIVDETVKPSAKFSSDFREKIQIQDEEKKDD